MTHCPSVLDVTGKTTWHQKCKCYRFGCYWCVYCSAPVSEDRMRYRSVLTSSTFSASSSIWLTPCAESTSSSGCRDGLATESTSSSSLPGRELRSSETPSPHLLVVDGGLRSRLHARSPRSRTRRDLVGRCPSSVSDAKSSLMSSMSRSQRFSSTPPSNVAPGAWVALESSTRRGLTTSAAGIMA